MRTISKFAILLPAAALLFLHGFGPARAELIKREGKLVTVRETAEADLGEGTKKGVKEKAKLAAIRSAIEQYVGVQITSQSTMTNFQLEKDTVNSYQRAYVRSVKEISYKYDRAAEKGVYVGEFVLDTGAVAGMAEAERVLAANKDKPVEASVFLFDEEGRMIADGGSVRAGNRFNIMVQPVGDVYAYIINRDSLGNFLSIFPNEDISRHRNPLQDGIQYYFPPRDADMIFAFDDNPGRERFYFLLSAVPMKDMDSLFAKFRGGASVAEKKALAPMLEDRVAARGGAMQSKKTEANLQLGGGKGAGSGKQVGEVLRGTGAFVKTISLNHVR